MWPTSEGFARVLASGERHWSTRIEVIYQGERVEDFEAVLEGNVGLDDVAVRRELNVKLLDVAGDLTPVAASDLLAPKGTEIRVWRGLLVDGEFEWVPLGVFGIIDTGVEAHAPGTSLSIKAFDRVDAVRRRRFTAPYRVAGGTATHSAIAGIVGSRLPGVPQRITTTGHTVPEVTFDRLSDPWDAVRLVADADQMTAYFDQLGTLIVTPRLEQETGVVYAPGPGSLYVDSSRNIDADDTYSGVVVSVEHPDQLPIIAEAWDLDPRSPTYADGPFGRRPFGFASPLITTQAQAQEAANTILARVKRMRMTARLTTVGHPGHDIGDVVTIIDPETRTAGRWTVVGGTVPTRAGKIRLNFEEALDG